MTQLRRWAKNISCVVVRLAPSEAKEWAQATAREMEFIESDWAALRWALGSGRILLERRETAISSLQEVPQAALRFAKQIRKRTALGCTVCVLETVCFASFPHWMRNPTQQLGCYLVVGAMLYMTLQLLARRGALSVRSNLPASADAYRLELERQRDFHSGGWLWSRLFMMVPGFLLFCIGGAIAHPALTEHFATMEVVFVFFCVIAVPANLKFARKYQRRIDDLDAVERNEV